MLTYDILERPPLVHVVGRGTVRLPAVLTLVNELRADPRLRPGLPALLDLRAVELDQPGQDRALAVAAHLEETRERRAGARLAVVTSRDVVFGFCRMVVSLRSANVDPETGVFRDPEEALRWLGLVPGELDDDDVRRLLRAERPDA